MVNFDEFDIEEYENTNKSQDINVGDKIVHDKLGKGTVVNIWHSKKYKNKIVKVYLYRRKENAYFLWSLTDDHITKI